MPFVTTGEVEFVDCHVISEVEVQSGSALHLEDTFITTLTATDTGTALTIDASNSRFQTVTLTNLANLGYAIFRGCRVTTRFVASGCTNIDADIDVQSTVNSTAVDVDTCTMVRMVGTVRHTGNATCVRWDDVVAGELAMLIIPGGTDNTYDAVSFEGVCDRVSIRGSIRGAIFSAANPRYGLAVAAGCLLIDVWTPISGYQTGAIQDLTAGQVTVH